MNKFLFIVMTALLLTITFSCSHPTDSESKSEPKKSGFNSPEEYMENPSVKSGVNESNMSINYGDDFPPLAGTYDATGSVTKTCSDMDELVGAKVDSEIKLYDQTESGKIKFRERVGGITAWGSGGYITGNNGKFTIWQESTQQGEEAGLPNDLTIYVSLLMSGTKKSNGDLTAKTLAIVTDATSENSEYNLSNIRGIWWMTSVNLDLIGNLSQPENTENILQKKLIQEIVNLLK